ncbi:ATP-binding cassette domain-containing protein [Pigmentibacter sp. JX0631]|uniref:ATP-binding cassette domain-containing protein n=1 Tax=Pigmentibacter sp. JX0631 TaxID=2976982 RepID=UPI002468A0CE|nr:ATP-binding cassette domain-containing protein [Pigmentibacter sp. JX0631]WGL58646.1 ATP-binding cassette domain-containing protein [Pigmentibacter sp. JX0631]
MITNFIKNKKNLSLITVGISLGIISAILNSSIIPIINKTIFSSDINYTLIVFVFLLCILSKIISQKIMVKLSVLAIEDIRVWFSKVLYKSNVEEIEKKGNSKLLVNFKEDIYNISEGISAIPEAIISSITVISLCIYIFIISYKIFFISIISLLIIFIFMLIINKISEKYLIKERSSNIQLYSNIESYIKSIKMLKMSRQKKEYFNEKIFYKLFTEISSLTKKTNNFIFFSQAVSEIYIMILIIIVIIVSKSIFNHSLEVITGSIFCIIYITGTISNFSNILQTILRSKVSSKNLIDTSQELGLDGIKYNLIDSTKHISEIKLENICHKFKESEFNIGPINYQFISGNIYYIVGGNGSGKTTISKIISLLYKPTEGTILINNEIVNEDNTFYFRNHICLVEIECNIINRLDLYINTSEKKEKFNKLLKVFKLDEKIEIKSNIINNLSYLSSGQKKRLYLTLSILDDDKSVYIFDEWAAEQDPIFKEYFYSDILSYLKKKNKIIIIITHDDQYFKLADNTLKINYGKIEHVK